jgi:hypothetical protein
MLGFESLVLGSWIKLRAPVSSQQRSELGLSISANIVLPDRIQSSLLLEFASANAALRALHPFVEFGLLHS